MWLQLEESRCEHDTGFVPVFRSMGDSATIWRPGLFLIATVYNSMWCNSMQWLSYEFLQHEDFNGEKRLNWIWKKKSSLPIRTIPGHRQTKLLRDLLMNSCLCKLCGYKKHNKYQLILPLLPDCVQFRAVTEVYVSSQSKSSSVDAVFA